MSGSKTDQGVTRVVKPATVEEADESGAIADTYGGRVHVEWDPTAAVTPLGQLPFFADFLKQSGLFDAWVSDSPLRYVSPNAPSEAGRAGDGAAGCAWRMPSLCAPDGVALRQGQSAAAGDDEDGERGRGAPRAWSRSTAAKGEKWMGEHLLHCVRPLLSEPWILDVDTTVKPLYGHQEGAEVGYNPGKRGRPSHSLHTYLMANVRLVLEVEVRSGKQNGSRHSQDGAVAPAGEDRAIELAEPAPRRLRIGGASR